MKSDGTKSVVAKDVPPVARWRVEARSGPAKGLFYRFSEGVVRIGSAKSNDVVLDDPKVSRHHLILEVRPTRLRARDLGSKNGTHYRGSRIEMAELPPAGAVLTLGETELTVGPEPDGACRSRETTSSRCGPLIGQGQVMQQLFGQIERVAPTTATVLIHGETGSGKELIAQAFHAHSERRDGPFVVVDCGAIPRDLIESELFGHVRGAFTGATADRRGAFERAHEGTIFLDEIGELPLDLQPRLLRALETGQVRPVGGDHVVECDVRVVAASLRELAAEVRAGRFREDLLFRLSVIRIEAPPLREHLDDIPMLVDHFLAELGTPPAGADTVRTLLSGSWPGNVRQLRNVLERASALAGGGPITVRPDDLDDYAKPSTTNATLSLPFKEAKDEVLARFTKEYLEALLLRNGGNLSAAAREAHIDRNWIVVLARRHGVRLRE